MSERMKDFLTLANISNEVMRDLLQNALDLKAEWRAGRNTSPLRGKILGMIFEKPSLRTRISFDVAMLQLGGQALMLGPQEIGINSRESTADVARVLSRYVQAVMLRTYAHSIIEEFAKNSDVPVINGLTDYAHPCQALADILTIVEHFGSLTGIHLVYMGDGNNVARSLLWASAHFGMKCTLVSPTGRSLPNEDLQAIQPLAETTSASIETSSDPKAVVRTAQVIYTDVWVSMGMEAEANTIAEFMPYQVNEELLALAPKEAIVLHCLPAHRGEEITDAVADGTQSQIFVQAENRLHAQKAILVALMGNVNQR